MIKLILKIEKKIPMAYLRKETVWQTKNAEKRELK